MKIGIVAGESSGDLLGAELIAELKKLLPEAVFEGIAGPRMISQGAKSLYSMERLSVMGVSEVFGRFFELYAARDKLCQYFCNEDIDVFIGIDAPDFNLGLEKKLHAAGIKTVHYVSPSVWAWRQYRVKKIARSTDLMLTLFPFEARFYQQHHVAVKFVGHPLAEIIPFENDKAKARHLLGLPIDKKIIALLPGSRSNELDFLSKDFLDVAVWCYQQIPELEFVVPFANEARRRQFTGIVESGYSHLPLRFFDGLAREVMTASDAVLLASGTAALEAMLLKRPMIVAYRVSALTYWIARRMVKVKHVSLPNHLLPSPLVPEYIQNEINPQIIGQKLLNYIQDEAKTALLVEEFKKVHQQLRSNATVTAAHAILQLLNQQEQI